MLALRHLIGQGTDPATWATPETPAAVRAEAVFHLDATVHTELLAKALSSSDPLVFHAAVASLARKALDDHAAIAVLQFAHPLADLLSQKRNAAARKKLADKGLANYLSSANLDVRYAAIKWIADDRLNQYRADIAQLLNDTQLECSCD